MEHDIGKITVHVRCTVRIHDFVVPTYTLVEFCCTKHSVLSDPVIYASHASALRITKDIDGSDLRVRDLVRKLWQRWEQLCTEATQANGTAVFEWPLTCKYWKSDADSPSDRRTRLDKRSANGGWCLPTPLRSTTGYSRSLVVHAGRNTRASKVATPYARGITRLSSAHKAFRRWIADQAWMS
eukprot:6455056-Amphidinium_carterae.3